MTWVGVKERLPDIGERTLTQEGDEYPTISINEYKGPLATYELRGINPWLSAQPDDTPVWESDESQWVVATHWMPLPEPES